MATTTMESRILQLLLPYRDECFKKANEQEDPEYVTELEHRERNALSLARNLAFMVQNHRFATEKRRKHKISGTAKVNGNDVSIVVRGWAGDTIGAEGGVIAVVVRYPAAMQTVVSARLEKGDDVIEKLRAAVDNALKFDF